MARGQAAAEVGDGGVAVGQLLEERQRPAMLGLRLRRLDPDQQEAEVVVAPGQAAAEVGDGGVVVGQLLADRQRLAVLGFRLRRLARLRQQDADAIDGVRQVAAGVVGGFGSVGQRLLVGPRQPEGRQGVGGLARGLQEPTHLRTAGRQRGPRRRIGTRRAGQQRLQPPAGRQSLVRLADRSEQPCDRDQASGDVDLGHDAGRRLGRQCLTRRQHSTMRRQGILGAADLARQIGQLEVGLRQRPPRGDVGLLAEQGAELAVEVRGRFQEPVAQLLEFLLLEQEVLTHAGVKGLDRVGCQLVPRLHRRARFGELAVGFIQGRVRVRFSRQRRGQPGIGRRLHRGHRGQAAQQRQ